MVIYWFIREGSNSHIGDTIGERVLKSKGVKKNIVVYELFQVFSICPEVLNSGTDRIDSHNRSYKS